VGIGLRLVQLGVPAVIAMQDYIAMDDARVFAAAFYPVAGAERAR
jgi:hypothetical protein